jgi:predicted HAD superfamily phosphohydrolase YqeG
VALSIVITTTNRAENYTTPGDVTRMRCPVSSAVQGGSEASRGLRAMSTRSGRLAVVDGRSDPLGVALDLNPDLLVLDLEPLVVHWRGGLEELELGLQRVEGRCGAIPVWLVTNSARGIREDRLPSGWIFLTQARKPWTALPLVPSAVRRVVVVGDQFLTDGLLALRIGASSYVTVGAPIDAPAWPRAMRMISSAVQWLLRPAWRKGTRGDN